MRLSRAIQSARRWHAVLPERGVLALEGAQSRQLLQGLTTANVDKLDEGPLYTAFLNAQGRVLFDAFLVAAADGVHIDVDARSLAALGKHLRRYKLRSKVVISDRSEELSVAVACGADGDEPPSQSGAAAAADCMPAWRDPRLPCLGWRAIVSRSASRPFDTEAAPPELYNLVSTLLGVGNGSAHLPAAEALPLESNLDLLNGVAFDKGCYLGQELTARTHFRGVTRKRLVPVAAAELLSDSPPSAGEALELGSGALGFLAAEELRLAALLRRGADGDLLLARAAAEPSEAVALKDGAGKSAGKLRAYDPATGLGVALCRIDAVGGGAPLTSEEGLDVVAFRPSWWPERVRTDSAAAD